MKTLNQITYGCSPDEMGTTGLVEYVRGAFWPYVPESTCFVARMQLACEIIEKRTGKTEAVKIFVKLVLTR